MNKVVKLVLLVVGVLLLIYGTYTLITPEAKVSIGVLDIIESQDNTNAYITIGLGLVAIIVSAIVGKK